MKPMKDFDAPSSFFTVMAGIALLLSIANQNQYLAIVAVCFAVFAMG